MIERRREITKFHPGVYLKDALDALEMTAKEFSIRTGISERMISGIITGNCDVSFEIAFKLSEYFGNSVNFWTNLQNQYNASKKEQEMLKSLSEDWKLVKNVKDYLSAFQIIDSSDDNNTIVLKVRKFVGVNQLTLLDNKDLLVCFKEQHTMKGLNSYFYQNLWIAIALNEARKRESGTYNREELISKLPTIRKMTTMKKDIFYPELQQMFKDCGVSFVLLPYLSKSNIYGATKWLNKDNVMLSVSNRGGKADLFWFTVCHEIAHVLMEHKREALLSIDGVDDKEADAKAEDILIPREEWNKFIINNNFSSSSIKCFANKIGIHPCIVLGRLHNENKLPYSTLDTKFTPIYKFY